MASAIPQLNGARAPSESVAYLVLRYGFAIVAAAAALALTLIIRRGTGSATFFSFYVAIFVSMWFAGRGPGWLSFALSSLLLHYFFFASPGFMGFSREEMPTLVAFVLSGVTAAALSAQRSRAEEALRQAGQRLELTVQDRTAELKRTNEALLSEVADRKRMEEALRASEERWRRVFDSSAVPMALADGNRRIVAVNPACVRLLGYSSEEFMSMSALDFTYGDDRDVSARMLQELEQGLRRDFQGELRFRRKDGTPIWVNVSVSYVPATAITPALFPAVIEDVTQRKQAEFDRQRLASIVELSGDMMGIMDLEGNPLYINEAGLKLVGLDLAELRTRKGSHFFFREDRPFMADVAWPIVLNKGSWSGEVRLRHFKTQQAIPVLCNAFRIDDPETGQATNTGVVCRDISERKRAEQALYASEERWRRLFEASAAGIALASMDGRYIAANAAFLRMLGYTEAELKQRTALDITHVDERAITERVIADFAGGARQEYHVEKRYLKKDGTPVWVDVTTAYVPASGSIPPLMQAVVIDIDDRKRAEAALRASEERWRTVFETTSVGIATSDANRRILRANAALQRMLGYTEAELQALGWDAPTHEDDEILTDACVADLIEGREQAFRAEKRYRRKDGEFIWANVSASYVPATEASRAVFASIVVDITGRKRAEETLRQSQAELARVARVTTIGELGASIAHEINQPLAAIAASGNACQRWLENGQNLARAKESLNRIISDANRASDVIKRIRSLTNRKPPEHLELGINEVVDEVLTFARNELQAKGILIRRELRSDLPSVMGDRVQLQQVILNLVMNGIDAMADVTDRRRILSVKSQLDERGSVLVTVQDSGAGLDPQHAELVFSAFFTTKPDGMGMGLAISTSIVEAHGGRLWVSAGEHPGTAFHFTLPAAGRKGS
jgi:PAS domain S-box-containing protein